MEQKNLRMLYNLIQRNGEMQQKSEYSEASKCLIAAINKQESKEVVIPLIAESAVLIEQLKIMYGYGEVESYINNIMDSCAKDNMSEEKLV